MPGHFRATCWPCRPAGISAGRPISQSRIGTNNIGDLRLTARQRRYQVMSLAAEVNPPSPPWRRVVWLIAITEFDERGWHQPAGGVSVGVRVTGGAEISQAGDISGNLGWGAAGLSDYDGMIRLRIGVSTGRGGNHRALEILQSGAVKGTFQATVVPRNYDWVWRHEAGGGVSGRLGSSAAARGEPGNQKMRQAVINNVPQDESIARRRTPQFREEVLRWAADESRRIITAKAKAGAGLEQAFDMGASYRFAPNATDRYENALRSFTWRWARRSRSATGWRRRFKLLGLNLEPFMLGSRLEETSGNIRLGAMRARPNWDSRW